MDIGGIGQGRIAAMREQMRQVVENLQGSAAGRPVTGTGLASGVGSTTGVAAPSFADALRQSLDKVNEGQLSAESMSQRFSLGDERVQLSDVMIERQKASLSLQATVQVRNKLVSAYHEIMNMSV